jgi:hypothetical protein
MRSIRMAAFLLSALLLGSTTASATITLTGVSFEDNAFADEVLEVQGVWLGNVSAVLGPTINDCTWNQARDENAFIKVAFTDNSIRNGPGADLVMFEETGADPGDPVKITISGITQTYPTPLRSGPVNAAFVDLDDFGIAPGDCIAVMTLWGGATEPEYMGIGALNNGCAIPAPAAAGLVGVGLLSLPALRRRVR